MCEMMGVMTVEEVEKLKDMKPEENPHDFQKTTFENMVEIQKSFVSEN